MKCLSGAQRRISRRRAADIPLRPPRVIPYLCAQPPAVVSGDRLARQVIVQ